jgi:hypothetical protein
VTGLRDILDAEGGAARQRRIREEEGPAALREALRIGPRV